MLVSYETRYNESEYPKLCKVIVSGDEEVTVSLNLANRDEVPDIPDEVIWKHMSNLVDWMKIAVQSLILVPQGKSPDDGWPVIGWPEISRINEEVVSWWAYITYRDEKVEVIHHVPEI